MAKRTESKERAGKTGAVKKTAGKTRIAKPAAKKPAAKRGAAKNTAAKKTAKSAARKSVCVSVPESGTGGSRPLNLPAKPEDVKYSDGELAMLREKQLELAMDGDRQMLIWLGKAVLGQTPASARGDRVADGDGDVIVLTPEEAVALYGVRGGCEERDVRGAGGRGSWRETAVGR
ncbi:MAG: hypothetical protein J6S40_05930 [Thermoguttaceae bacterium]|nr:hypothetical protein [Thermoguttaceae bacterium]